MHIWKTFLRNFSFNFTNEPFHFIHIFHNSSTMKESHSKNWWKLFSELSLNGFEMNSIAQNSTVFVIKFTRKKHWDENEKLDGEEEGESVEKYSQYARENQARKTFSSIFFPSYFWYSQSTRVSHHLTWWWYHFLKCMCT